MQDAPKQARPAEDWPELDVIQHWFQAVVTHPYGVQAGAESREAAGLLTRDAGSAVEYVITRSRLVSALDRLSIYANAYYTRLLECLGDNFPVLKRTLGDEAFNALAFGYLQAYPSRSYTLGRLGERFSEYLAETRPDCDRSFGDPGERTVGWPDFLIDLAKFEWTIAEVFDGKGIEGTPCAYAEQLLSISPEDWPTLQVCLAPCLRLLSVRFPMNEYYTDVRRSSDGVRVSIPSPANSYIAITRRDYIVRRHDLSSCQYELLAALQGGYSLGEAIERAASFSTQPDHALAAELSQWFRDWASLQFIASIEPVASVAKGTEKMSTNVIAAIVSALSAAPPAVQEIMERIESHSFAPIDDGRTQDPVLAKDGVADLRDETWRIHLLAIRDLARLGPQAAPDVAPFLKDENANVRTVAAILLGFYPSSENEELLIGALRADTDPVVRSHAVISLAQLKSKKALSILEGAAKSDPSRDVRHQCDLAIHRITKYAGPEIDLAAAYAALDESTFEHVRVGQPAIDFVLDDTEGNAWRLSDFKGKKDVVLIWIFADWCPVCHNEFRELIHLKEQYAAQDVEVVTIECHDMYRARVMVGREFQPTYWFSKSSPQGFYEGKIWWRHLSDPAGSIGAMYGVQPMEFVVHSAWINRPATVIVDKEGAVRFAYYGTYWGDRPSIGNTLEMVKSHRFDFVHPKRLESSQVRQAP